MRRQLVGLFKVNLKQLPENGVIHIRGPGNNFWEWILPFLVRPDVRVIVSEDKVHLSQVTNILWHNLESEAPPVIPGIFDFQSLEGVWKEVGLRLRDYFPKDFFNFVKLIHQRVWVVQDFKTIIFDPRENLRTQDHPFDGVTLIPPADLILSRYPVATFDARPKLKTNGLVWVVSEDFDLRAPGYNQGVSLKDAQGVGRFETNINSGYDIFDGIGYLMMWTGSEPK